jgi:hypothetical protein
METSGKNYYPFSIGVQGRAAGAGICNYPCQITGAVPDQGHGLILERSQDYLPGSLRGYSISAGSPTRQSNCPARPAAWSASLILP